MIVYIKEQQDRRKKKTSMFGDHFSLEYPINNFSKKFQRKNKFLGYFFAIMDFLIFQGIVKFILWTYLLMRLSWRCSRARPRPSGPRSLQRSSGHRFRGLRLLLLLLLLRLLLLLLFLLLCLLSASIASTSPPGASRFITHLSI